MGAPIKAENVVVSEEADREAYGLLISRRLTRSARRSGFRAFDHRSTPTKEGHPQFPCAMRDTDGLA
jgi:hypothetical protein